MAVKVWHSHGRANHPIPGEVHCQTLEPEASEILGPASSYWYFAFTQYIQGYMTQKEEAFQPLNMPDLEEIVNEAGEQGLQMTLGGWLFFSFFFPYKQ